MKKTSFALLAAMAVAFAATADTALYFNGSTYISLGKKFALGDSVSLSAWVRIDPSITVNPPTGSNYAGAGIVGQGYWGGTTGFGIFLSGSIATADTSDDKVSAQVRYGDDPCIGLSYSNPTLFTAGEWHHYLLVRDKAAGKAHLYADGVLVHSKDFPSTATIYATSGKTTTFFAFGKNMANVGGIFRGYIADVGLWDIALDADDAIKLTYQSPDKIGKTPYAFWPLDEGSGSNIKDKISGTSYPKSAGTLNWVEDPHLTRNKGIAITGSPAELGMPSPGYGNLSTNLGQSINFAYPAAVTTNEGTIAHCLGWRFDLADGTRFSGETLSTNIVFSNECIPSTFTWLFDPPEHHVECATSTGGAVSSTGGYFTEGTALSFTATPDASHTFYKWTGDVPGGVDPKNPTIAFTADRPRSLTAIFAPLIHLSTTGSDANDGASWTTAIATVTNAVARGCVAGSVVVISNGTYSLPRTITLTNAITLRGVTGNPADVILQRPTSATTNYRLFNMKHREATLKSLTLQRGCHAAVYVYGGGVYIYSEGGTVTNCILRGNKTDGHHGSGSAVYCESSAGVVTHCVISNNTTSIYENNPGGAVSMQYGRIDNCLVTKNSDMTSNYGGMIALNYSAVAENCTVVANSAKACSGIYLYNNASSAKVRNCVIAYNTSTSARAEDIVWRVQTAAHSSAFVNCVSDFYAPNANCHAGPDLVFADTTAGDWRPTISSSAVDVGGTIVNHSALDLDGNPRMVDAIDAGCYELQKNGLMAGFTPSAPNGFTPASVTFTATVIGAGDGDVLEYRWDFDNDGQIDEVTSSPSITHVYTSGGVYSVSLTVADTTTDQTATTTMNNVFKANPRILYVVNGNPDAAEPYDTWAIAANTIQKAINYSAAGAEVVVSNGTYSLTAGVNVNKEIVLHGLTGNPEDVVLDGRGSVRCLEMNAGRGGLVHSLTMHRGYVSGNWVYGGGAFVHTAGGTISNCIVRGCHGGGKWGAGGGLYASCDNALFTHCIITNNTSSTGTDGGYITGTAVHLEGAASLAHSLVANNRYTGGWCESTVRVDSGAVRFCTIVGNKARDFGGVNLYGTKAKVEHCIIAGNTSSWTNTNAYPNAARYKVWGAGRTYKQSNVASDDATRATLAISRQITNCVADAVLVNDWCHQEAISTTLPKYVAKGDPTPGPDSIARNAVGTTGTYVMPETDVLRRPRLFGPRYDLGAVESQRNASLVLMLQ